MGVSIEQLNFKYRTETDPWDFSLFDAWLKKKGIAQDIIDLSLKLALDDFTLETLPDDHFSFDNSVYLRCLVTENNLIKERQALIQKDSHDRSAWRKLSKLEKIILVLKGKD